MVGSLFLCREEKSAPLRASPKPGFGCAGRPACADEIIIKPGFDCAGRPDLVGEILLAATRFVCKIVAWAALARPGFLPLVASIPLLQLLDPVPPAIVAGDIRWVVRPLDPNQGDQVSLLRSAGGGVWSCLYPDSSIRLVRTTLRTRVARDQTPGVRYAHPLAPVVVTDALLAALLGALDQAGASWNAGNTELEICSADVHAIVGAAVARPAPDLLLGMAAGDAAPSAVGGFFGLRACIGFVRRLPFWIWNATVPCGSRPTRAAALGLAVFVFYSSPKSMGTMIGLVTLLTAVSTSVQYTFTQIQEMGLMFAKFAEEATKDIGSFKGAVSGIPGWCWAGLLLWALWCFSAHHPSLITPSSVPISTAAALSQLTSPIPPSAPTRSRETDVLIGKLLDEQRSLRRTIMYLEEQSSRAEPAAPLAVIDEAPEDSRLATMITRVEAMEGLM
jgi:hypothetical protein